MAAGALSEAFGAPVYVGAEDDEMLNDAEKSGYAGMMGVPRANWLHIDAVPFGDAVSACGMDIAVLPTPGHTKGSVCLYLEGEGVLFSGDTLFRAGYGRLDLYGGDLHSMIESLKKLFTLPQGVKVYPGHGGATTIGEERARYRL
jgi:glyoxylase-like metal-dependent hydrolase (beta-lactamase superfamily II)